MRIEKITRKEIQDLYRKHHALDSHCAPKKFIGILGGLGPESSIDLERNIFNLTPAGEEQEHFRVLHFSNPGLADRTLSLQEIKKNNFTPAEMIIHETAEIIDILFTFNENYQCEVLVIPCSSLFCFFDDLQTRRYRVRGIGYYCKGRPYEDKVLNTIEETALFAQEKFPLVSTFGLLATAGTMEQKLYQKAFKKVNKRIIIPDKDVLKNHIMAAIYGIKMKKKKEAKALLLKAVSHLTQRGAEMIVLGCSELPLVLRGEKYLDTNFILATAAVKKILTSS